MEISSVTEGGNFTINKITIIFSRKMVCQRVK